jgi:hypothetical protein
VLLAVGGVFVVLVMVAAVGLFLVLKAKREREQAQAEAEVRAMQQAFQRQAVNQPPPLGADPFQPGVPGPAPGFGPVPPPAPAAGGASVTLSNLRRVRGLGARDELEVTFEYTSGSPMALSDRLVVETADGTGTVDLNGFQKQGTVTIRAFGFGDFRGRVRVWVERGAIGPPGTQGTKISNEVTLN